MGIEVENLTLSFLPLVLHYEARLANLNILEFALNFVHVLRFSANLQNWQLWLFQRKTQLKYKVFEIDHPNYIRAYSGWRLFGVVNKAKKLRILLIYLNVQSWVAFFDGNDSRKLRKRLRLQQNFFLIQILQTNGMKPKRALSQSISPQQNNLIVLIHLHNPYLVVA